MGDVLCGHGHGGTQFVGFSEDVGVEECFADDAHSEVGHLLVNIDHAPIKPGLLNLFAVVSHNIGVASDMAWLEGWGDELALVSVEIAFATEDAVTNRGAKGIVNGYAFVEVISMFDQNAVNVLWFVEQNAGE